MDMNLYYFISIAYRVPDPGRFFVSGRLECA